MSEFVLVLLALLLVLQSFALVALAWVAVRGPQAFKAAAAGQTVSPGPKTATAAFYQGPMGITPGAKHGA